LVSFHQKASTDNRVETFFNILAELYSRIPQVQKPALEKWQFIALIEK